MKSAWMLSSLLLTWAPLAAGVADSPVGVWKTIDDKTGGTRGWWELTEQNGELFGKILRTLPPEDPNPPGNKCEGERKGRPVVGMVFLWGLKRDGAEFNGGSILDPDNGKIYKARIRLEEGGRKLNVRGFIGFSLLGRSQVWIRER